MYGLKAQTTKRVYSMLGTNNIKRPSIGPSLNTELCKEIPRDVLNTCHHMLLQSSTFDVKIPHTMLLKKLSLFLLSNKVNFLIRIGALHPFVNWCSNFSITNVCCLASTLRLQFCIYLYVNVRPLDLFYLVYSNSIAYIILQVLIFHL